MDNQDDLERYPAGWLDGELGADEEIRMHEFRQPRRERCIHRSIAIARNCQEHRQPATGQIREARASRTSAYRLAIVA